MKCNDHLLFVFFASLVLTAPCWAVQPAALPESDTDSSLHSLSMQQSPLDPTDSEGSSHPLSTPPLKADPAETAPEEADIDAVITNEYVRLAQSYEEIEYHLRNTTEDVQDLMSYHDPAAGIKLIFWGRQNSFPANSRYALSIKKIPNNILDYPQIVHLLRLSRLWTWESSSIQALNSLLDDGLKPQELNIHLNPGDLPRNFMNTMRERIIDFIEKMRDSASELEKALFPPSEGLISNALTMGTNVVRRIAGMAPAPTPYTLESNFAHFAPEDQRGSFLKIKHYGGETRQRAEEASSLENLEEVRFFLTSWNTTWPDLLQRPGINAELESYKKDLADQTLKETINLTHENFWQSIKKFSSTLNTNRSIQYMTLKVPDSIFFSISKGLSQRMTVTNQLSKPPIFCLGAYVNSDTMKKRLGEIIALPNLIIRWFGDESEFELWNSNIRGNPKSRVLFKASPPDFDVVTRISPFWTDIRWNQDEIRPSA